MNTIIVSLKEQIYEEFIKYLKNLFIKDLSSFLDCSFKKV